MMDNFAATLLVIFLAHLAGDFLFQSSVLIHKKKRLFWLLIHSFVHGVLAYLLIGSWKMWLPPLIIMVTHVFFDWIKINFRATKIIEDSLFIFLIDQILHFTVLILVVQFIYSPGGIVPLWFSLFPVIAKTGALILSGILLLVPFGGVLIGYFTRPFQDQLLKRFQTGSLRPIEGLKDGGKYIGYLERVLIFVFILSGQFAGVGFLIAAKSIFRFGELKDSDNRKQAEYIIIGTFASFLFAILVSLLVASLLKSM